MKATTGAVLDRVASELEETFFALPTDFPVEGDIMATTGDIWNVAMGRVEPCLLTLDRPDQSARIIGALEDGLHVTLYFTSQIIRQSLQENPDIQNDELARRLEASSYILSILTSIGRLNAVTVENTLGFRSETFMNPAQKLNLYGTTVSAAAVDAFSGADKIQVVGLCPFREKLINIYPTIGRSVVSALLGGDADILGAKDGK
jgi:hypothetical protein